jgi:hypothetical protein
MGCHSMVGPRRQQSEAGPARTSVELQKLYRYAGFPADTNAEFSGAAMGSPTKLGPGAKPIPWVRIHKLPEYVRFPHMRHVSAGVTCQSCHGQVQGMTRVYQASSLNMGWCVSCHLNGYSDEEGLKAAGYDAPAQVSTAASPALELAVGAAQRKTAPYDCAICHY